MTRPLATNGWTMPSEYRVRIVESGPSGTKKRYKVGTLEKCEKLMEWIRVDRESGRLAPYWDDIEMRIETREVTKWRPHDYS